MEKNISEIIGKIKSEAANKSIDELVAMAKEVEPEKKLVAAFAACYNAVKEGLGLTTFDEQLAAGIALTKGRIVEMATGEGKTISCVFAAFYHVIGGGFVHVLTFNDYLAKRDCLWMKPVYDLLGVCVDYIVEKTPQDVRKKVYKSVDVLYITAKECCFDYLRDFVVEDADLMVQNGFSMAIVDEADSLLIDEARIPLVVAGNVKVEPDLEMPLIMDFVKTFDDGDYEISLERKNAYLTGAGSKKAERYFKVNNIYDSENNEILTKINDCLKAVFMLKEDVDYIVRNGEIQLIDEFTGRVALNRHYPGSLQTAVELMHGVKVTSRGTIMGTIPLQFFVRKYEKLAGMTGTAVSAKEEFFQLYDMTLEVIEPHRPSQRLDHELQIYYNKEAKMKAVAEAVTTAHQKNQPVLIGTQDIEDSELLAEILKNCGITELALLNAKNDEQEAEIIKNAGKAGAVTISANMAGRGVDIKLGGFDESEHDVVEAAGGLLVIGTFYAESSRINDQLKGRSGRQGEVGESRLFISLDEKIMEKFKLKTLIPQRHYPSPTEKQITDKIVLREVARIQRISEGNSLDERKRLLKFTMISEKHRNAVFGARLRFLDGKSTPRIWEKMPLYENVVEQYGKAKIDELERKTAAAIINEFWSSYLEFTDALSEGIHLSVIAGKNPAEEYNISCEEYFEGMEDEVIDAMEEKLNQLAEMGIEHYEIVVPTKIQTYLLENSSDELNKQTFMEKMLLDQEVPDDFDDYAKDDEDENDYVSILDEPEKTDVDEPENKPKKFSLKGLFAKKK